MTITLTHILNFDALPRPEAEALLYNRLVPACEEKGIFLSQYGNHSGRGALSTIADYQQQKTTLSLFNVEGVQRAFAYVSVFFQPARRYYGQGSYGLKHVVEREQHEYLANGDLIAAMLMSGFTARFAMRRKPLNVNCEFKVKPH